MMRIVTDSTCNLTPEQLQRYDIKVAPITIQFGMETYAEGVDIDRALFYRKVDELGIIPTTSQPSPGVFASYYRELTTQGHSILTITITKEHSGTYQSAILARDLVPKLTLKSLTRPLSLSGQATWCWRRRGRPKPGKAERA